MLISQLDRHKSHINAFKICSMSDFSDVITNFITDPFISSDDEDDIDLFQDFVFSKKFGKLHIYYYSFILKNKDKESVAMILSKYLDFLKHVSVFFLYDAFDYIFKTKDTKLIELMIKSLSSDLKIKFIEYSDRYPNIIDLIPKLKLYNLFS